MKYLIGILICCGLLGSLVILESGHQNQKDELNSKLIELAMEYAYFEGQKDVLEGNLKIEQQNENYVWVGSPWDDNKPAIYNPSLNFLQNQKLIKN